MLLQYRLEHVQVANKLFGAEVIAFLADTILCFLADSIFCLVVPAPLLTESPPDCLDTIPEVANGGSFNLASLPVAMRLKLNSHSI